MNDTKCWYYFCSIQYVWEKHITRQYTLQNIHQAIQYFTPNMVHGQLAISTFLLFSGRSSSFGGGGPVCLGFGGGGGVESSSSSMPDRSRPSRTERVVMTLGSCNFLPSIKIRIIEVTSSNKMYLLLWSECNQNAYKWFSIYRLGSIRIFFLIYTRWAKLTYYI